MDGAADATTAAALGAWESIRGFFTPATLFLVVNLVIGTIALTSRSHHQRRRRGGYNSHDDADADADVDARHHHVQEQENQYYDQQQQYVPPPPAPLARTSSVMDRLRSIGLYRFRSGDFPPEYAPAAGTDSQDAAAPATHGDVHYARSRSEPAPMRGKKRATGPSGMKKSSSEVRKAEVAPAPASAPAWVVRAAVLDEEDGVVDERAEEFADSFAAQPPPAQQEEEEEEVYYQEEYVPPLRPAPLARTSSLLDRFRSFSLYRLRSGDLGPDAATAGSAHDAATTAAAEEKKQAQAAHYARSRSEPAREKSKKDKKQQQQLAAADARMTKSSSEARKPAAAPQEEPEAESVDARADDFINSFRQQLQLQRLNSLLNYKQSGAK